MKNKLLQHCLEENFKYSDGTFLVSLKNKKKMAELDFIT